MALRTTRASGARLATPRTLAGPAWPIHSGPDRPAPLARAAEATCAYRAQFVTLWRHNTARTAMAVPLERCSVGAAATKCGRLGTAGTGNGSGGVKSSTVCRAAPNCPRAQIALHAFLMEIRRLDGGDAYAGVLTDNLFLRSIKKAISDRGPELSCAMFRQSVSSWAVAPRGRSMVARCSRGDSNLNVRHIAQTVAAFSDNLVAAISWPDCLAVTPCVVTRIFVPSAAVLRSSTSFKNSKQYRMYMCWLTGALQITHAESFWAMVIDLIKYPGVAVSSCVRRDKLGPGAFVGRASLI
mmetsp:Transcript_92512/g.283227  ORF Transcript_92512/g.283227 Transcript_92512/m.283227 type:complete len:297 (-) Transcript_92512:490-1380(-)